MKKIFKYEQLMLLVSIASKLVASRPDLNSEATGGYFCHTLIKDDQNDFDTPSMHLVGEIPWKRKFGRMKNALEKVLRIIEFSLKTSFEKWDESLKQFGGGIRYRDIVCAFSGFPEKVDEAICVIYSAFCYSSSYQDFVSNMEIEVQKYKNNDYLEWMYSEFLRLNTSWS